MKNLQNRKGFTLVELMIVVAIMGILAAIVIPLLQQNKFKEIHNKIENNQPVTKEEKEYYDAKKDIEQYKSYLAGQISKTAGKVAEEANKIANKAANTQGNTAQANKNQPASFEKEAELSAVVSYANSYLASMNLGENYKNLLTAAKDSGKYDLSELAKIEQDLKITQLINDREGARNNNQENQAAQEEQPSDPKAYKAPKW